MEYTIFSIEDDKDIALIISKTLTHQGFTVKSFGTAKEFYDEFKVNKPDMILLDMMLPDKSGKEILMDIRKDIKNDDIDIIIVSANHMVMDKIDGLDLGADDYIEKPFDLLELMSRVNARFRRKNKTHIISSGPLTLNSNTYQANYNGVDVILTSKEFEILSYLVKNNERIVSRDELLSNIWGVDYLETRTIDMHIKSLRKKMGEEVIQTVYGLGYRVVR